jgi:hypothetical protein
MCGQMRIIAPPWQVSAQLRFSVNMWCAVPDDHAISLFIFEGLLPGRLCLRFLQEELPQPLEEVPLNKRDCVHFHQDEAPPHYFRESQIFPELSFPWAMDQTWQSSQLAIQVSGLSLLDSSVPGRCKKWSTA